MEETNKESQFFHPLQQQDNTGIPIAQGTQAAELFASSPSNTKPITEQQLSTTNANEQPNVSPPSHQPATNNNAIPNMESSSSTYETNPAYPSVAPQQAHNANQQVFMSEPVLHSSTSNQEYTSALAGPSHSTADQQQLSASPTLPQQGIQQQPFTQPSSGQVYLQQQNMMQNNPQQRMHQSYPLEQPQSYTQQQRTNVPQNFTQQAMSVNHVPQPNNQELAAQSIGQPPNQVDVPNQPIQSPQFVSSSIQHQQYNISQQANAVQTNTINPHVPVSFSYENTSSPVKSVTRTLMDSVLEFRQNSQPISISNEDITKKLADAKAKGTKSVLVTFCQLSNQGYLESVCREIESHPFSQQGKSDIWVELKLLRAALLMQLRECDEARLELEVLGVEEGTPILESNAPILAIVLWSMLPAYGKDVQLTINRVHSIWEIVNEKLDHEQDQKLNETDNGYFISTIGDLSKSNLLIWRRRIFSILVSSLLHANELECTKEVCEELYKRKDIDSRTKHVALYLLSRWYLRQGNVDGAKRLVSLMKEDNYGERSMEFLFVLLMQGMIAFTEGKFEDSIGWFSQILQYKEVDFNHENNDMHVFERALGATFDDYHVLISSAVNNMAVAALHSCNLSQTISTLEEHLAKNFRENLHPILVYNLCSLYDLAHPPAESDNRKQTLKKISR